jgi:hypothetical protein
LPKGSEVTFRDATAVVLVPEPFSVTTWFAALSKENVAFPEKRVALLAVKENVKLADPPAARVTGTVPPVHWNPDPVTATDVTVVEVEPRLYTVTVCGKLLVVPAA